MTEPRTETGQIENKHWWHPGWCSRNKDDARNTECTCGWTDNLLAIETEAIDAFLASPEAARELAEAMSRVYGQDFVADAPADFLKEVADVLTEWQVIRK